jgi:hypothetical protein
MGAYVTVDELRDEGAASTVSDERLAELAEGASRFVDRVTGLFFELRKAQTYRLDGEDSPVLELPAPCITLTSVTISGAAVTDLTTSVVNRNRRETDDFWHPRLEWVTQYTRSERAFGVASRVRRWPRGQQNVVVVGDFGFVEADGSTPRLIRRAVRLLVIAIATPAGAMSTEQQNASRIVSESFGNYSYTLSDTALAASQSGVTGQAEVDAILLQFERARKIAAV